MGIFLISCEAQKDILVVVLDKTTLAPIDSVFIEVMAGKDDDFTKNYDMGYTDINGKFETSMMIGCAMGCYDIKIQYVKDGYLTKTELNNIVDTIYLEVSN